MKKNGSLRILPRMRVEHYGLLLALLWSLLLAYSLLCERKQNREEAELLGKMQANAFFEKDILYRRWASRHGGVYVPVTPSTQPNRFLSVPNRDLVTIDGSKLTLINPAYMTRQVYEIAGENEGSGRMHITSLRPLNPANAPDRWEKMALEAFQRGSTQRGEVDQVDGKPFYRYIKALTAEKGCLKCHARQGYKEGDVRGGLSVSIPLQPIYAIAGKKMHGVYLNHAFIWLMGLAVIGFGTRRLGRMTATLYEKNLELEQEVERRQLTQETLQEQAVQLEEEIAERRQIEEAMRISEEKFSKAFENAPIVMIISDSEDGTILEVNRKFSELTGFGRAEAVGRTTISLGLFCPEQRQQLQAALQPRGSASEVELSLRSKGGKLFKCLYYGELVTGSGRPYLLSLLHDVTEHRVMEEALQQAQKMEAIGQLAGGIAHDFNNILTVIMGYINLLSLDERIDGQSRERFEQILSASERAAQLTRGLLAFSRKQVMVPRPTNLNDLVHRVEKFLVRVIGEDIQLQTHCASSSIPVRADLAQLEQVLLNLATNARDAMPKGGLLRLETGSSEIGAAFIHERGYGTPGRYGCIKVTDSGCGMDDYTSKRIFEPFFTTKEVDKGTGLGMAIAYGIVKQHNGFITVRSRLGAGTTFTIYLPLLTDEEQPCREEIVPPAATGGTETILLAEDDAGVRALMAGVLSDYGYRVIVATDGQDAVEQFAANREDVELVLMDMIMPRKSGQEAMQEIKRLRPETKAVYLSGYTADFLKSRGVEEVGIELIAKPVQPFELLRKVREVLDA